MSGIGDAMGELFAIMLWGLFLCVPLAVWKLIDIIIWLVKHINVSWG